MKGLCILFFTLLFLGRMNAEDTTPVSFSLQPYRGAFANDLKMKEFIKKYPQLLSKAFSDACNGMGVNESDFDKSLIHTYFVDSDPFGNSQAFKSSQRSSVVVSGYKSQGKIYLIIFTQNIIVGNRPESSLHHEFVHIIHRYLIDERKYKENPDWIHEGLAMWFSGERDERLRSQWMIEKHEEKMVAMVNGLEETKKQKHFASDYLEDILAIEFLAKKGSGNESVKKFNNAILNGQDFKEAIKKITDFDWEDFKKQAKSYAESEIKKSRPTFHNEYLKLLDNTLSIEEFEKAAESFLSQCTDPLYKRHVQMERIRIYLRLKKYEETIKLAEDFLTVENPPISRLEDNVLMIKGACHHFLKNDKEIIDTYSRLSKYYPQSSGFKLNWYVLQVNSLKNLGRKKEGLTLAKKCLRKFPSHPQSATLRALIRIMES